MTRLRATTHLADGANQLFDSWIDTLSSAGLAIDGATGDDTSLDADVVFACGLLTALRHQQGHRLRVIGAPIFDGETAPVYRSVIIASPNVDVDDLADASNLRLAINEYDSWSGWHGLKEHLRATEVPSTAIGAHVLTGGHVNSITAVLEDRADVASIDHSVWNARCEADPTLQDVRILARTRDWPAPPISIRSTLPEQIQQELVQTLVALDSVRPAHLSDYAFMLTEAEEYPTWP